MSDSSLMRCDPICFAKTDQSAQEKYRRIRKVGREVGYIFVDIARKSLQEKMRESQNYDSEISKQLLPFGLSDRNEGSIDKIQLAKKNYGVFADVKIIISVDSIQLWALVLDHILAVASAKR
jgi:hypothetical protein